jgi:hypothetical protein
VQTIIRKATTRLSHEILFLRERNIGFPPFPSMDSRVFYEKRRKEARRRRRCITPEPVLRRHISVKKMGLDGPEKCSRPIFLKKQED